jgi:hypothetical protein
VNKKIMVNFEKKIIIYLEKKKIFFLNKIFLGLDVLRISNFPEELIEETNELVNFFQTPLRVIIKSFINY